MSIYNRNGLVTWREGEIKLYLEDYEDILNETPTIELDDGKKNIDFNYIINGNDQSLEHGPRLKIIRGTIGNKKDITFIVRRNGDLELRKSLLGGGCISDKLLSKLSALAGGFAKFAVKDIYDAFYSKNYNKEKMDEKYEEFNNLSKEEKSKYIKSAKSGMKRSNK